MRRRTSSVIIAIVSRQNQLIASGIRHAYRMNRRANLVLAVVVAGVVTLAVVTGWLSGGKTETFSPGTPEAVVQKYTTAILLDDRPEALTYLDPAMSCSEQDLQDSYAAGRAAVVLRATHTDGEESRVTLNITTYGEGPFEDFSHDVDFDLHRVDDEWLITGEPWPLFHCGEGA